MNTKYTLFHVVINVVTVSFIIFALSLFSVLLQAYTILSIWGMPLALNSSHHTSSLDITHKNTEVLVDKIELHKSCLTTGIPCFAWSLGGVLEC